MLYLFYYRLNYWDTDRPIRENTERVIERESERDGAVTLRDEQQPGGASRPVQVVVGEAAPPAQEADGEVGGHGTDGPREWLRFDLRDLD